MTNSSLAHEVPSSSPTDLWSIAPPQPALRDTQRLLVAVASGSGTCVDDSFEDAETFLLFEKFGHKTCFIGHQPCPLAGSDQTRRTRLLADCDLVLCAGISETCKNNLSAMGIDCDLAYAGSTVNEAVLAL
jgi:hypothetical protein